MTFQTQEFVKFAGRYQILKVENRRLIGGYASVEVKDSQGETITLEALKGALIPFMDAKLYRNVHVMHSNIEIGKVVEEIVDSDGYTWTTHVDDLGLFVVCELDRPIQEADRVWEAIERGELSDFSIAGEALHRTGEHGEIIDRLELHEITICVKGANPGAKFVIIKGLSIDVATLTKQVLDRIRKEYPGLIPQLGSIDLDELSKMTWQEVEDYEERRRMAMTARSPLVI
jgi:HK97 family phage prohead protease